MRCARLLLIWCNHPYIIREMLYLGFQQLEAFRLDAVIIHEQHSMCA